MRQHSFLVLICTFLIGGLSEARQQPDWIAESDQILSEFGLSVGAAGDVNGDQYSDVIIGAPSFDNGQQGEGRAYVYLGSATGLSTSVDWTVESDEPGAYFGNSVGTADVNGDGIDDVIVGAPWSNSNSGRAYVYLGSFPGGLSTTPSWTIQGASHSKFGFSVGSAGDVNGDGYDDVVVGAPSSGKGQAQLYHGSPAGLLTTPAWTVNGQLGDFGWVVGTAGDVNGDDYDDVIVKEQRPDDRVYVYMGSASGLSTTASWTVASGQADDGIYSQGRSAGTAGDVNHDGFDDVIVAEARFDNSHANAGRARVYLGSSLGLSTTPCWTAEGGQATAFFGMSVGSAGDVNSDGYDDVVVGELLYPEGRAHIYLGSTSGLSPSCWAVNGMAYSNFGRSVGNAGDVNRDGYSDVIVGAPLFTSDQPNEGRALVYYGPMVDVVPPVITCPPTIIVAVPRFGPSVSVTFSVSATDDVDPSPSIVCVPPSGTVFPLGTTTVTCMATDACGNTSICTFQVTVLPLLRMVFFGG